MNCIGRSREALGQGLGLGGWTRALASRPRFLALAGFLFAGDLKADPHLAWLPVDLTLLGAVVLVAVLIRRWRLGARLPGRLSLLLIGGWFLTFLAGLPGRVESPYGFQKVMTIFSFSLLAGLAPLLLLDEEADAIRLMNALAYFCLAITLAGLLGGAVGAGGTERLQAFGAGTISLGRATGLLFVAAALLLARVGAMAGLSFAILALAGVTAVFSGSRGPILAALVALVAAVGLGRPARDGGRGMGMVRLGLAGLAFVAVLVASLGLAPAGSLGRTQAFLRGQYGGSELYRAQALEQAWDLIKAHPVGLGWGGFATQVDPERGLDRQYPHNLLAEVSLEAGWLCGAWTLAVLALALAAAWSRTGTSAGQVVFAGTLFYLVNALVSGDLNDNRPLFMFVGTALSLREVPI